MVRIWINIRTHTKEKPYLINPYVLVNGKAKKVNRVSKIRVCMYVSEICAEGIFVTFPWWLENVKSRSKIALFSNERHFEIWFPKKRTIAFFWSKLSKLHKKDPILHVATTFSLKQGETRTSHGPIPHPLITSISVFVIIKLLIFSPHWLLNINTCDGPLINKKKVLTVEYMNIVLVRFHSLVVVVVVKYSCQSIWNRELTSPAGLVQMYSCSPIW